MASWQVQEAKARLSEVLDEAERHGPQTITSHGKEKAVVLSIEEYRGLTSQQPSLKDYLLGGPKVESFKIPRSRDTGRKIRF